MSEPIFLRIPTHRIRPNPHQPRRVITPSAIELMEASLREMGQQTPAKVRTLTEAEKIQDPDHDYDLIGGHIRHAGALKAGLATLDCLVYDYTPEQAELAGLMDNQSTEMHWLDWVIAIEKLYKVQNPKSQRKLAAQLGVTQPRINYALKVADALTPASRKLIDNTVITLGPENTVSEFAIRTIADLGDPKLVEKSLPVVLDRHLTEPQVKKLVEWIQAGNPIETFDHKVAPKTKSVPKTHTAPVHTAAPAQPASAQPPQPTEPEPNLVEDWHKLEWENAKKNKKVGEFIFLQIVAGAMVIGLIWGVCWIGWKAIAWVFSLVHWT